MSLDQNLFTLIVTPNKDDSNIVDLVDTSGITHYRKQRVASETGYYKAEVYDPTSESLLITVTAPSSTSKVKTLELCNPTLVVELKYTGTISFRWSFKWEEHEFEWKREECYMVRKPDPPVLVAVTKEPPGRLKTTSVQILDYNLNRFDIDDRKGLEIVILTALLSFQDANEAYHHQNTSSNPLLGMANRKSPSQSKPPESSSPPPPPPPKPAPKTGVDRIAEMQAIRGEYNEITVEDEGNVNDYARYGAQLLEDDAMLFVTIKSATADQVPKVLQVVEETKRIRHRAGLSEGEQLHQYVLYDTITSTPSKGPRRINLDDAEADKAKSKNKYSPPKSLIVHLSKISMPELQPKANINDKSSKLKKGPAPPVPSPSRDPTPTKKARSSSPHSRVPARQTNPYQPSPSPSQLNNPGIYVAPPPRPPPYSTSSQSLLNPASQNKPNQNSALPPRPSSFHGPPSAPPSLYGSHVPVNPVDSQNLSIPPWQQQQQPQSGSAAQQKLTPATVVSGIFDMLHRR